MKSKRILSAVLLSLLLLLSACTGDGGESVTTAPETTAPVTTAPTTTEPPRPAPDELLVLRDAASQDLLVGGDTQRGELLEVGYGIKITERDDADVVATVSHAVNAGKADDYAALVLTAKSAVALLCEGHLQDLGAAGVELDAALPEGDVSRSAAFGDGVYMLYSDALSSKYTSAQGVIYSGDAPDELLSLVLDGGFTLGEARRIAEEASSSISASVDERGMSLLYRGLGGNLFTVGEGGLPTVSLASDADAAAYGALLDTAAAFSADGGIFTVSALRAPSEGELWLPIPKASAQQIEYITPIDTDKVSVIALPDGITSAETARRLISALGEVCADVPDGVARMLAPSAGDALTVAKKMLTSLSVEQALLYGWGDLDSYLFENLVWRTDFDTLLADDSLAARREAVDIAVSIIRGRTEK